MTTNRLSSTTDLYWPFSLQESSDNLDKFAHHTIHGNGHSIWFDKSFTLMVFKNGRVSGISFHKPVAEPGRMFQEMLLFFYNSFLFPVV